MTILANSTATLSCSFPAPDPDTIHGVPLADLLARCRSMAHRYYRRQGRWEPYEEYLSAGHAALASCIQTYKPDLASSGGFKSYCLFQVEMACRDVRRAAYGSNNLPKHKRGQHMMPKYQVESWDHTQLALRSEQAKQEIITFLHEVLGYLGHEGTPASMLLSTAEGEPVHEVAAQWQCSDQNVKQHTMKVRRKLRAWASEITEEHTYDRA